MAFEQISSGKWQNYSNLSLVRFGGSSRRMHSASPSSSSPVSWRVLSVLTVGVKTLCPLLGSQSPVANVGEAEREEVVLGTQYDATTLGPRVHRTPEQPLSCRPGWRACLNLVLEGHALFTCSSRSHRPALSVSRSPSSCSSNSLSTWLNSLVWFAIKRWMLQTFRSHAEFVRTCQKYPHASKCLIKYSFT